MRISKWKNPIRYWRLVTTPTCDKCVNYRIGSISTGHKGCCVSERYLEHANRLEGTLYTKALVCNVRGTRWCDFEPIGEESVANE